MFWVMIIVLWKMVQWTLNSNMSPFKRTHELIKILRYTKDSKTRIPFKALFIERSLRQPQLSMTALSVFN